MRTLVTCLLAGTLAAGAAAARAQDAPASTPTLRPLCPDRPGKGTAPCTVDRGRWQLEVDAADYTRQSAGGSTTTSWVLASPELKYGLTDDLDLEASFAPFSHVSTRTAPGGPRQTLTGVGDLFLRAKLSLTGNSQDALGLAIEPYVKAPTASNGIGNGAWEGGVLAPVSLNLPHGWSLAATPEADLALDASGPGRHVALQLPVGLGHAIGPVAASVELWTQQDFDPAGTTRQYSVDLAAAWQPAGQPDLQLDAGVNLGLNAATPDVQIYAGVSRRF